MGKYEIKKENTFKMTTINKLWSVTKVIVGKMSYCLVLQKQRINNNLHKEWNLWSQVYFNNQSVKCITYLRFLQNQIIKIQLLLRYGHSILSFLKPLTYFRSSLPELFFKKGVLQVCSIFTGYYDSMISIKIICNLRMGVSCKFATYLQSNISVLDRHISKLYTGHFYEIIMICLLHVLTVKFRCTWNWKNIGQVLNSIISPWSNFLGGRSH